MEQFDNYLQHLKPMQDSSEEIIKTFSEMRQHLDTIMIKNHIVLTETMRETRNDVKNLEVVLSRKIHDSIISEVSFFDIKFC